MATLQLEAQVSADQLLSAIKQLSTPELEVLTQRVLNLRAQRVSPNAPQREAELLTKLRAEETPAANPRYRELDAKSRAAKITPKERKELIALVAQIENFDARRLKLLVELAQLRQKPFLEAIQEFGLGKDDA